MAAVPERTDMFKVGNEQLLVDQSTQVRWPEQVDTVQVRQVHSSITINNCRFVFQRQTEISLLTYLMIPFSHRHRKVSKV